MNANQEKILKLAKKKDLSKLKFRAIARELGINNAQTVIHHMGQLRKKGLLYFDPKKRQQVAKTKAFAVDNIFSIPIVGYANCGQALELAQNDILGYLKIGQKVVGRTKPEGLIAARAIGPSLNRASIDGDNIEEGDYVIVDCKQAPVNGKYVLSIIDGAANFKRYYKDDEKKEIRLVSESTLDIPPIVFHEEDLESSGYLVNGVVVKVIKK